MPWQHQPFELQGDLISFKLSGLFQLLSLLRDFEGDREGLLWISTPSKGILSGAATGLVATLARLNTNCLGVSGVAPWTLAKAGPSGVKSGACCGAGVGTGT